MTDWRKTTKVALVLVVLEGAIRKWILPQASDYVYFLKDLVLLIAYAQYFFLYGKRTNFWKQKALKLLFVLSAIVIVAQIFNPNLGSPLPGVFGARSYLIYLPLCFLVGDLFRNEEELKQFLRKYMLLAIPVCLLGVIQFFLPADSFLNTYAPSTASSMAATEVASFGQDSHARITGTFPYIAGHGSYTFTFLLIGLCLWLHEGRSRWKSILLAAVLLLQINVVMTGSRTPVYLSAIAIVTFALFSINGRTKKERKAVAVVGVVVLCMLVGTFLTPSAGEAFVDRASNAGDSATYRFFSPFLEPFDYFQYGGLTGYGVGITQSASQAITNSFGLPIPVQYAPPTENESTRVMLELGCLGFAFWYSMRIALIFSLWRTYSSLRTPFLRHLCLIAFLVHLLTLNSSLILNTTAGVYYWFLAGFIFLLPRVEKVNRNQEAAKLDSRLRSQTRELLPA